MYVAAEAIQLRDPEVTLVLFRLRQRDFKLRAALQRIVALAGVNLDKFVNDVEALSLGKVDQRRTLSVET